MPTKKKHPSKNKKLLLDEEANEEISKSELKRQMTYLQKLGEALLKERSSSLEQLPISPTLLEALQTAARIKHHEGKRRQMQFVGKLMRQEPAEVVSSIEQLLEHRYQNKKQQNKQQHLIEQWRDRLIDDDTLAIETFLSDYPSADRQWLRQMVRQHRQELSRSKPPAAARKIFAYVRDILAEKSSS